MPNRYIPPPKQIDTRFRFKGDKPSYLTCVYIKYEPGIGAYECGQPSHGHPHCPDCMSKQQIAPVGSRYVHGGERIVGVSLQRRPAA